MRKEEPNLERLEGYLFPLVAEALNSVGPPSALLAVDNEEERGPLLVTLAAQITIVGVGCLHNTLAAFSQREDYKRLLLLQPDSATARRIHSAGERIYLQLQTLEAGIIHLGYAELIPKQIPRRKCTQTLEGDFLIWRTKTGAQGRQLQKEYLSLLESYKSVTAKEDQDKSRVQAECCGLGIRHFDLAMPIVDFASSDPWVSDSPVGILQRTDLYWWSQFATAFMLNQRSRLRYGLLPLALRDPAMQGAHLGRSGENRDEVRVDFLSRNPEMYKKNDMIQSNFQWPPNQQNSAGLRQHRRTLRMEDKKAQEWIAATGGALHPFNFYAAHVDTQYTKERVVSELVSCLFRESRKNCVPQGSFGSSESMCGQRQINTQQPPPYCRRKQLCP
jgi:hypothetical protein